MRVAHENQSLDPMCLDFNEALAALGFRTGGSVGIHLACHQEALALGPNH
jgi:hypothetical protein